MTKTELDVLWNRALREALEAGEEFTRYRFAAMVASAEREACAKVCEAIENDLWALYKGRPPYTGKELERASEYTQGMSDGAGQCHGAIRARATP